MAPALSVVFLTNPGRKIGERYTYDSFGRQEVNAGGGNGGGGNGGGKGGGKKDTSTSEETFSQPYSFTGREWDSETGLYFYRARYYDPQAARFISRDPIGLAGGINLYIYPNNPISWSDPFGLEPWYNDPNHWLAWTFDPADPPSECKVRCVADKTIMLIPPFGICPFDIDYLSYKGGYTETLTSSGTADIVGSVAEVTSAKWNNISKVVKAAKPVAKATSLLSIPVNIWDYSADMDECNKRCQ
jgi:RHS repeat-associated protein